VQLPNEEVLSIPTTWAGFDTHLTATLYLPKGAGPHPLAVLNHGTAGLSGRREYERERMPLQSQWFLERGFAVLIPMRRGHGSSTPPIAESYGFCLSPDYVASSGEGADDIASGIRWVAEHRPIDAQQILLVGQSSGGMASLGLASRGFPGVRGVVNFAGGKGAIMPGVICRRERLVEAMRELGRTTRVPTLWIYSENDRTFEPELAQAMHQAFTESGGAAELWMAPPFLNNGHAFFGDWSLSWGPRVDAFLRPLFH
jgi:dienelactone hydrolase